VFGKLRELATTAALVGLALLLSCTTPRARRDWEIDLDHAEHLFNSDQFDEATQAYIGLLDNPPSGSDRRYVIYNLGRIAEQSGQFDEANEYYLSLIDDHLIYDEVDEYTARGLYRIGIIHYDHFHQYDEALRIWQELVRMYPDASGPAHRALDAVIVHYQTNDIIDEAIAYFSTEFRRLEQTPMGDNMLYWWAYWYRHYVGDSDTAFELFSRLRSQYYGISGVREEGEWEMVNIYHERGDHHREAQLLDAMRNEREFAFLFGPHASTSMENAGYQLGIVFLDHLSNPQQAIIEWRTFLETWIYSLQRDDAMYGIVRATEQLGDHQRLYEVVTEFREVYFESRWLDEVEALYAEATRGAQ